MHKLIHEEDKKFSEKAKDADKLNTRLVEDLKGHTIKQARIFGHSHPEMMHKHSGIWTDGNKHGY